MWCTASPAPARAAPRKTCALDRHRHKNGSRLNFPSFCCVPSASPRCEGRALLVSLTVGIQPLSFCKPPSTVHIEDRKCAVNSLWASRMDAISGGASVLAFITLAIQSAKTISVVLAGIKDAPDNVRRTANTVSMLQWALEQLAQSQQTSGAVFPRGIEEQVKTCSDNLAAFASTLGKLQSLDTDGRGRRVWKRVKAVIDEKELDKMTGTMAAHASTLNLSLQSTQMSEPSFGDLVSSTVSVYDANEFCLSVPSYTTKGTRSPSSPKPWAAFIPT